MTTFLLATTSVHVTAAAADYLQDRLDPAGDDRVVVVAVSEPDAPARDAGDALNVARSRLAEFVPTTETRDGDPVEQLLAAIDDHDPDEVLLGAGGDGDGVGETASALIARADRPVVVVPLA